jgi:hypothetical protein
MARAAQYGTHEVRFRPRLQIMAIAVVALNGPQKGYLKDLYVTQEQLEARARAAGRDTWTDDDVLAEAREQVEKLEGELVEICEHNTPVDEPCKVCAELADAAARQAELALRVPAPSDELAPIGG